MPREGKGKGRKRETSQSKSEENRQNADDESSPSDDGTQSSKKKRNEVKTVLCYEKENDDETSIEVTVHATKMPGGGFHVRGLRDAIKDKEQFEGKASSIKIYRYSRKNPEVIQDGPLKGTQFYFSLGTATTVALQPFESKFLQTITPSTTSWDDVGKLEFTGRADFSDKVKESIESLMKSPPSSPSNKTKKTGQGGPIFDGKLAWALVYSTVSGSGKTVSMLELKRALPKLLPKLNLVVGYLGFNCKLSLGEEEQQHIRERGEEGVGQVLARRLLGSVLISHNNPTEITKLPRYEGVYEGRTFLTVKQCKDILQRELNVAPQTPLCIVAGVDEVQLLNMSEVGGIGLGRLFLRILRQWQYYWYQDGFRLLPLGTGIATDWDADPTTGFNTPLYEGDSVLIKKGDFQKLAGDVVNGLNDTEFSKRFSSSSSNATVIDLITAAYWPRVRLLEWWRDGRNDALKSQIPDSNEGAWPIWLAHWMCDMPLGSTDPVPGKGDPEGKIHALFTVERNNQLRVIPDGYCSTSIIKSLQNLDPDSYKLYNGLDFFKSMQPSNFIPNGPYAFENLGFNVVGVSMYFGLMTLTNPKYTLFRENATPVQKNRLNLALWLQHHSVAPGQPVVLEDAREPTATVNDFYPFVDSSQLQLQPTVLEAIKKSFKNQQPIFIRSGRETCCDYMFLYWKFHGTDPGECIAILCDAKSTTCQAGDGETVTGSDQAGLFKAVVNVYTAFSNGALPKIAQVRSLFVTNRTKFTSVRADSEIGQRVTQVRDAALALFPLLRQEMLNKDTFDFGPFTDVLFARKK